jgi:hypothetical protein
MASHILSLLIESEKFEKCHKQAREFLNWLMQQRDIYSLQLSHNAYTFALMTLLKTNELAREFSTSQSFKVISDLLEGPCLEQP